MASKYTSTGTYTNLTRLQLEALRRADNFVGRKALTTGDSALTPEGVVGRGDPNAEPYNTGSLAFLQDAFPVPPPVQPGLGVSQGGITDQVYAGGFAATITTVMGLPAAGTFDVVNGLPNVTMSVPGSLEIGQTVIFSDQPAISYLVDNVGVLSGTAETIASFATPHVVLTGLSGMYPGVVGHTITIAGAANSGNNGTFVISAYSSISSVTIVNTGGVYPDANSGTGGISWSVADFGSATITPNYSGTGTTASTAIIVTPVPGTFTVGLNSQLVYATIDETWNLFPGQVIVFATQPTIAYTILSVSGIDIVLAQAYTGTSTAGVTAAFATVVVGNTLGLPPGPTSLFPEEVISGYITISGSSHPGNNGSFQIINFAVGVSPNSFTIVNLNAVTDAGPLHWHLAGEDPIWFGPQEIFNACLTKGEPALDGTATGTIQWTSTGGGFTAAGVAPGDILLIGTTYESPSLNSYATAVIGTVNSDTLLTLSSVNRGGATTLATVNQYGYVIIRPKAVQLFAVPGSGPTGSEQTFLTVLPGSTLHSNVDPTLAEINADRVQNLVPPQYSSGDRADSVYPLPSSIFTDLTGLGYRIILYPDDGSGSADLTSPIATLNPVIDPSIPSSDQRMSIDYKAGVIRFSCAPQTLGQIKKGVNSTTGRLNLYAVFWAIDQSFASNAAQSLFATRSIAGENTGAATISWNGNTWVFVQPTPGTSPNGIIPLAGPSLADNDGINTLDNPDPTTSIVKRLNAEYVLVCGDGVKSFGDFNGPDSINRAINYWQNTVGDSTHHLSCTIHVKHGTYTLSASLNSNFSDVVGQELRIIGDGRNSTTITGPGGAFHWASVQTGCQITFEDVTLISSGTLAMQLTGSIRARRCFFSGVQFSFKNLGTPLMASTLPPYFARFEDCEFNTGSYFQFGGTGGEGFLWQNCTFIGALATFQFTATTTSMPSEWRHVICEKCDFQVQGVSTFNATHINGTAGFTAGIMGVSAGANDLGMTLDQVLFEDCNVSSIDLSSDSIVLLHLFPLTYNATNALYRVQIGAVTIRGGTWSVPQGRGNDFVPFFLMCRNPVVENLTINGGGTAYTGLSAAPGFQANGNYTDAMRFALTGTNGYSYNASFLATIAASGQSLFSNLTGTTGFMSAIVSNTVTFTDGLIASQLSPGFIGMQITIWGASVSANNGTFPITAYSAGGPSIQYTNAGATTGGGETQNGDLSWSISATTQSGLTVHNLEVNNIPVQSFSGDLCLVGPLLNGGPVDVDGVLVTNLGGLATDANTPWSRIYLRPGAQYTVVSNVATVTGVSQSSGAGPTNGSTGTFRNITWAPQMPLATQGISYTAHTGTGSVSTGVLCIGYTGSVHIEDLHVLPPLSYDPTIPTVSQQHNVMPMCGITCTELWSTVTLAPQRGTLRLNNCTVTNMGRDYYTNAMIALSDFYTIEAKSLKAACNLNNYLGLGIANVVGIQVYPQYTQRGSGGFISPGGSPPIVLGPFNPSYASLGIASAGSMTITGLTGMQPSDLGGYITTSGAATSSNNDTFSITTVLSATSVVVSQGSSHAADANNGSITWAIANSVTSNWSLDNCRVEIDNVATGHTISGIQSFWSLATAQGALNSGNISQGTVQGCYVNLTTTNVSFTLAECYNLGSVDLNYTNGQVPVLNCFNNTAQTMTSAGTLAGNFSVYQYTGGITSPPGTQVAIGAGVSQCRGFWTSFAGDILTANPMVFNSGVLKSP